MKIKTLVAMLFLSAGATTVVAQDATNCNSNSSISHEAVRAGLSLIHISEPTRH